MKKSDHFTLKRNQVSFLAMLCLVFGSMLTIAQTPTPVFARVMMQKVPAGKEQEFEKFVKETLKPIHQLRKQKGKIINWIVFKVHFAGAADEYNMKVKPGMGEEYLKVEKDDWKPFHQLNADNGKAAGWGLWQLIFPGGSATTHDYATSTCFSSYSQPAEIDYAKTFKQANPTKDVTASFERAEKSRALVRSELWEMIEGLN